MTSPDENRIMKGTVWAGGVTPRQPPPGSATPQTTKMIDPLRIQYFAQRLRGMSHLHLDVTLAAMRLGQQERPSRESAAFFAARVVACEQEYERRGLPTPPADPTLPTRSVDPVLIDRVRTVRRLHNEGLTLKAIAAETGVSDTRVSQILQGIPNYARAVPPEVE